MKSILLRALVIAALWGVPVSLFSTLQKHYEHASHLGRRPGGLPKIRTLSEIAPHTSAVAKASISAQVTAWQGPLPMVGGSEWIGSIESGNLTATLQDSGWFIPGSVDLSAEGRAAIRSLREGLSALPVSTDQVRVSIEAHSDSSPVVRLKARFPTNWELTGARASAVVRELMSLGLAPAQLSGTGVADSRPISQLPTLNRRIQITVRFEPPVSGRWDMAQR